MLPITELTQECRLDLAAAICLAGISGNTVSSVLNQFDCHPFTTSQLAAFDLIDIPNQEVAIKLVKQLI